MNCTNKVISLHHHRPLCCVGPIISPGAGYFSIPSWKPKNWILLNSVVIKSFFFMKTMNFISHKKSIIYRWCISTSLCNSTLKNSIYTIYQIFSLFLIYLKCLPSDSFRCIYNSNTNTWHCVTIIHLVVKKYHLLKTLYLIHCWSYKKMIFMHRLKTWGDVGIYLFYKNIKMFITRKKLSNFSISITKIILTCLIMHYLFSKNTITHYLFKFIYNNKNLVKILPLEEFQFS